VTLLPIELEHVARVAALPWHHRDPFVRLLAGRALHERLTVISADRVFRRHGVKRLWQGAAKGDGARRRDAG
jgi:PIN domain nuclease of toxin-antitoxin system